MKRFITVTAIFCAFFFLQSCKFSCSVGGKGEEPSGKSVEKNGAQVYNNIKIEAYKARLKRAYLEFEDGTRVPDDNFVDFSQPVNLRLQIDGGWEQQGGNVMLGASEKIIQEDGTVILDEKDLFKSYPDGIKASDARAIYLTASIRVRKDAPPASFSVQFRVWDKAGDGYVEGSYMLFSK